MGRGHQFRTTRGEGRRTWRDRGATLVEYSVIIAFLAVVSIPAAQYLQTESKQEAINQADCVRRRPPPPSCQLPALTTTTTASGGGGTTTTVGPTTTTTLPPPPVNPAWSGGSVRTSPTVWTATGNVTVTSAGLPVAGVTVYTRWRASAPVAGQFFYVQCVTDAAGTCSVSFTAPGPNVTEMVGTVYQITSDPPPTGLPMSLTFPAPP